MLTSIGQILALCIQMTNLKLEASCGFDRQFAMQWYEKEYLTGNHTRFVMKPNLTINSHEDGKVYRAFNCSDAKALELMEKEPAYRDYFIDLQAESVVIPELGDEPPAEQPETVVIPEVAEEQAPEAEPEAVSEEEAAALKRSEAAKKAAATRAAKKAAAEEAEAAELAEFEGE